VARKKEVHMLRLEYDVVDSYELLSVDTYRYGSAPYSGRDDRIGQILEVTLPSGKKCFITYEESYYRYECTYNDDGINTIYIDDANEQCFIEIESDTTDFHFSRYDTLQEAKEAIEKVEDLGYYRVIFT